MQTNTKIILRFDWWKADVYFAWGGSLLWTSIAWGCSEFHTSIGAKKLEKCIKNLILCSILLPLISGKCKWKGWFVVCRNMCDTFRNFKFPLGDQQIEVPIPHPLTTFHANAKIKILLTCIKGIKRFYKEGILLTLYFKLD